jgi:protein-S-isoprenylcysteine O-methyltransferase Ste14
MIFQAFHRNQAKEKALLSTFGDEYRGHMNKIWRLIPGW